MLDRATPPTRHLLGTFLGTVFAFAPWAHLLADRGTGAADTWIDRGLVVISLLGVLVLINRFAPDVFPPIIRIVTVIRSGKAARTGEHRHRGYREDDTP